VTSLFPELEFYENPRDRRAAFARARKALFGQKRNLLLYLVCLIAFAAIVGAGVGLLGVWVKSEFGFESSWWRHLAVGMMCGIYALAANLFFRRPIRRKLREQLKAAGIVVCLECGYNLSGNLSGRCPECGKGVAKT